MQQQQQKQQQVSPVKAYKLPPSRHWSTAPDFLMEEFTSSEMSADEEHIIVSDRHQTSVLKKMKSLREKPALCDVTLQIDDMKIPAHRVVLAASSSYFEFMFTGNVKESSKDCIEIKGFCPTAFAALIDFMYTGYLLVKEENIMDLLKVADFLRVVDAKAECLSYLQRHIKISNCISIRNIAKKHFFTELEKKVNSFICYNFSDVIYTDEFFNLSLEEIKDFIVEENFWTNTALCEEAISSWVEYDETQREVSRDELSRAARFHYESLSKRGVGVYNAREQKNVFFSIKGAISNQVLFLDLNNLSCRSARCRPTFQSICSIFHKNSICLISQKSNECGIYNFEKEDWILNKMPFNNYYCAGCSIHDQICLISSNDCRATFSYEVEKNTLNVQPSLIHKRTSPGVTFDGCSIYVCGGGTESAERRDIRTKDWRSVSNLPRNVDVCSATSLDHNVYCTSRNGNFYQYDSRNGIWMEKALIPCSNKRSAKTEPSTLSTAAGTASSNTGSTSFALHTEKPGAIFGSTISSTNGSAKQELITPAFSFMTPQSNPGSISFTIPNEKAFGSPQTGKVTPCFNKGSVILGATDEFIYTYNENSLYKYVPSEDEWERITEMPGYDDIVCVYP